MILGQVSYLDCLVFATFLVPQLLYQVSWLDLLFCGLHLVPFALLQLPYSFIRKRYLTPRQQQPAFIQQSSPFEQAIIEITRYGFAKIPAKIGWVFFSKPVALPFFRFRMLRHGYLNSPIKWREVDLGLTERGDKVRGVYMTPNFDARPDVIIFHCHGGGFSLGSTYFYLEFLVAWVSLLQSTAGYKNPAIFSLEYTLVPYASYPTQIEQALVGYDYVRSKIQDAARIVVSGDSAGATLILSLLLHLEQRRSSKTPLLSEGSPKSKSASRASYAYTSSSASSSPANSVTELTPRANTSSRASDKPGFAALISPWATLSSPANENTEADYLDAATLDLYGRQYACGNHARTNTHNSSISAALHDPLISPGACTSGTQWTRAAPSAGFGILYGSEEVLAPELRRLITLWRRHGVPVSAREEHGGIHAWPVVALFLSDAQSKRQKGLRDLVGLVRDAVPPALGS